MLVDREGAGLLQDSLSRAHLIQGAVRADDEMIGRERRLVPEDAVLGNYGIDLLHVALPRPSGVGIISTIPYPRRRAGHS